MRVLTKSESDDLLADTLAWVEVVMDTGRITFATRPLEKMFGYDLPGELEGEHVEKLVPSDKRERHARVHRTGFAEAPVQKMVRCIAGQRKDGTTFPVEVWLMPKAANRSRVVVALVFDRSEIAPGV